MKANGEILPSLLYPAYLEEGLLGRSKALQSSWHRNHVIHIPLFSMGGNVAHSKWEGGVWKAVEIGGGKKEILLSFLLWEKVRRMAFHWVWSKGEGSSVHWILRKRSMWKEFLVCLGHAGRNCSYLFLSCCKGQFSLLTISVLFSEAFKCLAFFYFP